MRDDGFVGCLFLSRARTFFAEKLLDATRGECNVTLVTSQRKQWSRGLFMSVEIAYTEQRENHGTMILHGVSYSAYTFR